MREINPFTSGAAVTIFWLLLSILPTNLTAQEGANEIPFDLHYFIDTTDELSIGAILGEPVQEQLSKQPTILTNFGFDPNSYWFELTVDEKYVQQGVLEVAQTSLDTVTVYTFDGVEWRGQTLGHAFNPTEKPYSGVNFAFDISEAAAAYPVYINVRTTGTVAVPIQFFSVKGYHSFKLRRTLFLGVFFGLMAVMAVYNLLLYIYLRDKAYLLYVGATIFGLATSLVLNGYGYLFVWPNNARLDDHIYLTLAGLSMVFSSRFAASFLNLKRFDPLLDKYLWGIAIASLLMSLLSLFFDATQLLLYGRLLVLIAFPSYIVIGVRAYRRGYKTAIYYIIAWLPYILGLVLVTLRGAGLVPEVLVTAYGVEIGGASEAVLLSLALAARIKGMRKEIAEKELEKEQFRTKLLSEQKVLLEQKVTERTKELAEANATKDKFFSIIAHDLRSPMIALQGVGQKLDYFIRKEKYDKLLEVGGKIDQSIDQLNHLLNNLLNWATSQNQGIPYHPEKLLLTDLIQENVALYQSLAETKSVEFQFQTKESYIYADLNTVSTVFRNVLSNALKFSPENGIIRIEALPKADKLIVAISDQGPGMAQAQVDQYATRLSKSTVGTKGEKGFGLGLKLCFEFMALNQGSMHINSELGEGTTVELTFLTKPSQ